MGETFLAAVLAVVTVIAAVFFVVELVGDLAVLGDGMAVVGWILAAAAAALVALTVTSRGRGQGTSATSGRTVVTTHIHAGGDLRTARNHEGGHGAMTERLGGRVVEMQVNPDGSGHCRSEFPRELTPRERAALAYAGGLAAGESLSGGPCSSDRRNARDAIASGHRWSDRAAVDRAAREDARRAVGHGLLFPRSDVARVARRVQGPR